MSLGQDRDGTGGWHRCYVALMAQVHQWRYQADHAIAADTATGTAIEERAAVLRECAYELERLIEAEMAKRSE